MRLLTDQECQALAAKLDTQHLSLPQQIHHQQQTQKLANQLCYLTITPAELSLQNGNPIIPAKHPTTSTIITKTTANKILKLLKNQTSNIQN